MVERDVEFCPDRAVEITGEVKIVPSGFRRHRRMEEPGIAQIDSPKKLPVALQVGMQHIVEGLAWKACEELMQTCRAEHQKDHQAVVIPPRLTDACLLPNP